MKEMIILITMFFADPSYTGQDAITIDSYNGRPLIFTDADKCEKWIWDDLENLKKYVFEHEMIICLLIEEDVVMGFVSFTL